MEQSHAQKLASSMTEQKRPWPISPPGIHIKSRSIRPTFYMYVASCDLNPESAGSVTQADA